jgi:NADPH2:quinone reductase
MVQQVRALTDGAGVEVVYDSVGRDTFERSLDCLRPRGLMVLYGGSSGPVAPVDPQDLNRRGSLYLTRPALSHFIADREELTGRADELFALVGSGELEVTIHAEYPLAEAAQAHRDIESGTTMGKLLLLP